MRSAIICGHPASLPLVEPKAKVLHRYIIMNPIYHALIAYLIYIPLYLVLAAYSLRYYASSANVSKENIQLFLQDLIPFLRWCYSEPSSHNLLTKDTTADVSQYLLTVSHSESLVKRIYISIAGVFTIAAITVNLTRQKETIWILEHIGLIFAHLITFYWAWTFGSKLRNGKFDN